MPLARKHEHWTGATHVAGFVQCRALEEMQRACQAADAASREAEASSSASAAALQEQLLRVRQLQAQLDTVSMQHSMQMQAAQQAMKEQVRVVHAPVP
jgi:hypothetical protein